MGRGGRVRRHPAGRAASDDRHGRDAIAADAHIPIALLDDPDPEIREAAAYVPAASTSRAGEISTALHDRFLAETAGVSARA
ncbi:hypothetical protein ACFZBU_40150 [Embleya sp. NPDC008237]|uniref:hypothetical protein n=1 Tax=Embleya sp. NPDC008237 TaxID=3363978 RepID=UPI0036EE1F13